MTTDTVRDFLRTWSKMPRSSPTGFTCPRYLAAIDAAHLEDWAFCAAFQPKGLTFTYRHYGAALVRGLGQDLSGYEASREQLGAFGEKQREDYKAVVMSGEPSHAKGSWKLDNGDELSFIRAAVPIYAPDTRICHHIVGIVHYTHLPDHHVELGRSVLELENFALARLTASQGEKDVELI